MDEVSTRKADTKFIQLSGKLLAASGFNLTSIIRAVEKPRTFRSFVTVGGPTFVVAKLANLPEHRARAARILGGPVEVVWATSAGTIWRLK